MLCPAYNVRLSRAAAFGSGLSLLILLAAAQTQAGDIQLVDATGDAWVMTVTPRLAQAEAAPVAPSAPDDATAPLALDDATAPPAPGVAPPAAPVEEGPVAEGSMTVQPLDGVSRVMVNGMTYEQAYASIPYRRHEYLANPSYRHEAAMELLFGQMRPTTIHKQQAARWVHEPELTPYRPYIPAKFDYWTVPRPVIGLPYWYGGGLW
ncbi:hypothetical protein [Maioricimonas rarisocia]|nr:hypothetical protein [Maioricimonas rarisocia]